MGYVGARVVYKMGADVGRAREMGSYRLIELLGKGGMGEVWRAEHRMLARPAAIKLIRPEMLGVGAGESVDVLKQRFEREAFATSLLRSPHTIEVYDFGVTDDGTFYYVMELLDGFDLDDFVERFGPVERFWRPVVFVPPFQFGRGTSDLVPLAAVPARLHLSLIYAQDHLQALDRPGRSLPD